MTIRGFLTEEGVKTDKGSITNEPIEKGFATLNDGGKLEDIKGQVCSVREICVWSLNDAEKPNVADHRNKTVAEEGIGKKNVPGNQICSVTKTLLMYIDTENTVDIESQTCVNDEQKRTTDTEEILNGECGSGICKHFWNVNK